MKCKNTYQLFDYLEQKLAPEQMIFMKNHIESCPECIATLTILQKSFEVIENQKQIKYNPFLISRIEAKLYQKENWRIHLYKRVLQPVFVCSVVLISLFGGYTLSLKFQNTGKTTISQEYQEYVFQEPLELALQNE